MEFELESWGDGTFRLVHWDNTHGNDVILEIRDGAAYEHSYEGNNEIVRKVNLAAFLEELKPRTSANLTTA